MLQMLWRLNFLVTLLCLTLGNPYILYYICPLHTFYFFVVYATMRVMPHRNHGKWDIRVKLLVS
jgi:N-acetylneuraminate 9-O-acetyltransferase